jgi:hypothetical protein
MELYEILNCLANKTEELDFNNSEVYKSYDPYKINKFVGTVEYYIPVVNAINKYNLPKDVHYTYLNTIIPKRPQRFNNIFKKFKEDKYVLAICKYFEVGITEAKEYMNILDEHQINEIFELYNNK